MLSKAEVQYLQGQKQLSKSYEYKIKSIIKILINLLDRDLPLLSTLFPNLLDLTKFSKINERFIDTNLTRFRKKRNMLLDLKKSVASERLRVQRTLSNGHPSLNATKFSNKENPNSNFDQNRRRERDSNPRGPHGPQAI